MSIADHNLSPIGDRLSADHLSPIGERSPSLTQFLAMTLQAFERLPQELRSRCAGVEICAQDWPPPSCLEVWEKPSDVCGSYAVYGNSVWLYRRPLLELAKRHPDLPLALVIEVILAHEIGHAMGLGDAEMACLENGEI
jgi:predicted Zn-dependent protease with MMP-like domain